MAAVNLALYTRHGWRFWRRCNTDERYTVWASWSCPGWCAVPRGEWSTEISTCCHRSDKWRFRTSGAGSRSIARLDDKVSSELVVAVGFIRAWRSAAARIWASSAPWISRAAAARRAGIAAPRLLKLSDAAPRGDGDG